MTRAQICLKAPEIFRMEEIREMYQYLEHQNYLCTEECNQTNPECDIELKAERDQIMAQLASILSKSSSSKKSKAPGIDLERINACLASPQDFDVKEIMVMIQDMEKLNYECTEECNQTKMECDIEIKAKRDYAIEQLTKYLSHSRFDMEKIRTCVENPGFCNIETMTTMLQDLENVMDVDDDISEEQEDLREKLISQIANSKDYMNQIKQVVDQTEASTVEDVIDTMLQDSTTKTMIRKKLGSSTGKASRNKYRDERTDEYLVQI